MSSQIRISFIAFATGNGQSVWKKTDTQSTKFSFINFYNRSYPTPPSSIIACSNFDRTLKHVISFRKKFVVLKKKKKKKKRTGTGWYRCRDHRLARHISWPSSSVFRAPNSRNHGRSIAGLAWHIGAPHLRGRRPVSACTCASAYYIINEESGRRVVERERRSFAERDRQDGRKRARERVGSGWVHGGRKTNIPRGGEPAGVYAAP